MKTRFSLLILLLALLLTACQPSPAPATTAAPESEIEYPAPSGQNLAPENVDGAYPPIVEQPSGAYPDPVLVGPSGAYPGPGEGETVDWETAVQLINSGQVTAVFQNHDLTVTLTTVDGRTLVTTEPSIDEVFNVIDECGEACSNISVATE